MNFKAFTMLIGATLATPIFVLGVLSLSTTKSVAAYRQSENQTEIIALGRKLFFDTTLSSPPGMACVTCHDPTAGFSYPESEVNQNMGPVPGVIPGRFGFRKVPTAAYSSFLPTGVPTFNQKLNAYVGGLFFDGRETDTTTQAEQPFLNPNEMDNIVHNLGSPSLVVEKVKDGPSGAMFRAVYGQNVFNQPVANVYTLIAQTIGAFEASPTVAPFSSKYDAWLQGKATLTSDEMTGLMMYTGTENGKIGGLPFKYDAHCSECHGIISNPAIGPDLFTFSCYANLGVPKNPNNPYYTMTNAQSDPLGYNPLGANFIDYGLGDFLYPYLGLPAADLAQGDPLAIDGTFKTPTLRNVDMRPSPTFIKCYMHNGVFKSLKQVVHFYNTRNLTTYPGEVIDFTLPNPYANLKGTPLWPPPEWPSPLTLINPQGASNLIENGGMSNEQIGNMGMTDQMEDQLVDFLEDLTDGYFDPDAGTTVGHGVSGKP